MAETVDLRALIRLIPPARALKNDLEEASTRNFMKAPAI